MEKLFLSFREEHLSEVLQLAQGFQGIQIETGYESSIPSAQKAEIDKTIRETEEAIAEIQSARSILKGRESNGLLSAFTSGGEKTLSIEAFTKTVEESDWRRILGEVIDTDRWLQDNRKRRRQVTKQLEETKIWEPLRCNPSDFQKLHRATAVFGSVHEKHWDELAESLTQHEDDGVAFERVIQEGDRVYCLVIFHNSISEQINIYLNEVSFSAEEYPFDKPCASVKRDLEREEKKLLEDEIEINRQIVAQAKYDEILAFAEDYNLNALLRMQMSLDVTYEGEDIEIEGWILADRSKQFEALLEKHIPRAEYRLVISPVREKDIGEVPIQLKNGRLTRHYERLTEMFSLPRYDEIDPTPVMTIFYLVFFGMMVADFGYGLAIFLVGLVVRRFLKLKRSTKSFIDFLYFLSFPIMGWGLIFGAVFGLSLPFGLLSVTVDIITLTLISLVLGYLHIMTGLVLQIINQFKRKNYYEGLTGGLAWFLTFLGGGLMILSAFLPIPILFWIGAVLLGLGLGMTLLVPAIQYGKRWLAGFGKGLYTLYGATSYMGDFISYTRLMALGVAGGSVALAFNTILGYLPLVLRFTLGIVLAIVLHGLNIFLSMLSAYVHGIRLQFIEFFGKFYTGGGKKFEAFKVAEKNVIISETSEE